jgi:signal transduction histidine kinase/CheY-like chemotaxis protein
MEELQQQNQELLDALQELQRRREEVRQLSHELEDTNRGVLALYAELDERAQRLRQADELKSRFLSNMSHEFRTPLNSIIALSHLLLVRSDGELTAEQEKQVNYIRQSATHLLEMVNDLLDLAKVEAGKLTVRPRRFTVANLFSALRGMMRPLTTNDDVSLIFDEPNDLPPLYTDEGKVSQIMHNLIANALKFTERGSVHVSASLAPDGENIRLSVADTGIGIAPENQERIFHEFGQLEHPIQQRVKGTGLGLPLSRRLAELLGGTLTVESQVGEGSTFLVHIPCIYPPAGPTAVGPAGDESPTVAEGRGRVLVIDDEEISRYLLRNYLSGSGYSLSEATSGATGLAEARRQQPDVIVLDLVMPHMSGFQVLKRLQSDPALHDIPVVILSSKQLTEAEQDELALHAAAILSKENVTREIVLQQIEKALAKD